MRREAVAVLGGTFDPVHLGHLEIARRVRETLGVARVLLLPTAVPPHKPAGELAPASDRETMVRLAVAGRPGLEICPLELGTDSPCYTIDTLRRLRAGDPPLDPLFVVGTDTLLTLPTWRDWRGVVAEFDLVAVDREGRALDAVRDELHPEIRARLAPAGRLERPGSGGRILHLAGAPIPISSSEIRRRAARGEPLETLVPPPVARYIQEAGLYGTEAER